MVTARVCSTRVPVRFQIRACTETHPALSERVLKRAQLVRLADRRMKHFCGRLIGPGPLARLGLLLPRRPSRPSRKHPCFVARSSVPVRCVGLKPAVTCPNENQLFTPEQLPALFRTTPNRKCAQCGADVIAAEWSEHLPDRRVRNVWSCESCGYQFEDTVYLPASG
jgi:ribosomal protein S27AE